MSAKDMSSPLLSAPRPAAAPAVGGVAAAPSVQLDVATDSPRSYGAVATAAPVAASDVAVAAGDVAVAAGDAKAAGQRATNGQARKRLLLLAIGSRGDVQPMVALALALIKSNPSYIVDIGADTAFESFIGEHKAAGVGFVPVKGNLEEWLATSTAGKALKKVKNPFVMIRMVKQAFSPLVTMWWTDIHEALKARHYDLAVLSGISPAFATALFEAYPDTRLVWLFLFPAMHPTASFLPATSSRYQSPCGGAFNKAVWNSMASMAAGIYDDIVNSLRTERLALNTDGSRPWWGTFQLVDKWHLPIIDAYSTALVPQPPDWPEHHRVTGALFLDAGKTVSTANPADLKEPVEGGTPVAAAVAAPAPASAAAAPGAASGGGGAGVAAAYVPHPLLASFLDPQQHGGEQAVYLGLGSMMSCFMERDRTEEVGRILAAAAKRVGRRAVILTAGWTAEAARVFGVADLTKAVAGGSAGDVKDAFSLLKPEFADGSVLPIAGVPHDYVFPRVCAVVTHGGAGTTHAALRAGKPTVFVPFGADQPWWGQLCVARGLAAACISYTDVTTENLSAALRVAAEDQNMRRACLRVADEMNAETGCANAVAVIERELRATVAGPFSDKRPNEWAAFQHHMSAGPPKSFAKLYAVLVFLAVLLLIIGGSTSWFGTRSSA